jgi:hypothetical protein
VAPVEPAGTAALTSFSPALRRNSRTTQETVCNFGQWALGLKGQPGLWHVVVKEGTQKSARIGTISYLAVIGSATLAFWFWHRRSGHPDGAA